MRDPNHVWNDGNPIRTEKQACSCHINDTIFTLCSWGQDIKKTADGYYKLYMNEDEPRGTFDYKAAHWGSFVIHRDAYLKHINTGKDWVL